MQTDSPSSSRFLTVGDECLKAFNMSVLGDTNDYQWKEIHGSVQLAGQFSTLFLLLNHRNFAGTSNLTGLMPSLFSEIDA